MDTELSDTIQHNLKMLRERIDKAAIRAGRESSEIDVVAVTKQKSAAVIKSLVELGVNKIGESYLNETLFKMDLLKDYDIEWHMIGAIQKGKERRIVPKFSEVHSVENLEMAKSLDKYSGLDGKILPVYLEFNVSGEDSKHGWPAWREPGWMDLLADMEETLGLDNIKIMGLMTMAPYSADAEDARPYFAKLRKLRDFFSKNIAGYKGNGLSMGMSGDFEVAIEEGATVLRIGSAIVGQRN